jgi:hypothetical protein
MLCDKVVFEQGTQKPYLLGVFTGVAAARFPTDPQRFDIFAALTDMRGDVIMDLSVVHLDTDQEIYSRRLTVHFPDPLRVVNLRIEVGELIYPGPGTYLFALAIGDEEIAARRVRVYQIGGSR